MLSDSSEADCDILQTVDLPAKVVNDQAEMTLHQSAEWSTACSPYFDRHIYTIYEIEDEKKPSISRAEVEN